MKMKKKLSLILLLALLFTACGKNEGVPQEGKDAAVSGELSVIATIFPPYDFTRNIAGDSAVVKQLLPAGAESHTYEPSPRDIIAIQNCDLFIYVGGESDVWIEDILEAMGEDAPETLSLLSCVQTVEEEIKEGMQAEEHGHDEQDRAEVHAAEPDEHVWTSPKNAVLITEKIAERLAELDEKNAGEYNKNAIAYIEELRALDADFKELTDNAVRKTIVVGDRFPFIYMARDYGLDYFAAFPGCSSEGEAGASTVRFLTDKVESEKLPVVLYIEFSTHKVADAIASETGAKTLLLHSCHNVSSEEQKAGATYLSLMRQNLETLKTALY